LQRLPKSVVADAGPLIAFGRIGELDFLLAAKKLGLIQSVRPILDAFTANGYHFSDNLIRAIVLRAGEL
jgi:predicted nucleic acid-binding protein